MRVLLIAAITSLAMPALAHPGHDNESTSAPLVHALLAMAYVGVVLAAGWWWTRRTEARAKTPQRKE